MENKADDKEKLVNKEDKNENYNDTNTNPFTGEKNMWSHENVCGIVAVPGLEFQSKTVFAQCQHCSHSGETDVETKWNFLSVAFCYYCSCCFGIKQILQGKDRRLMDATHKCSSCKQVVGEYESC